MDDLVLAAYECALRRNVFIDEEIAAELSVDVASIADCRKELQALRLLISSGPSSPAIPINPEVAEAELTAPLEESIRRHRQDISEIHRSLQKALRVYRAGAFRQEGGESIRVLNDQDAVERELALARRRCTREVLVMQPGGGRSARSLQEVSGRVLDMIDRGVQWYILYQHSARTSLATRAYMQRVCAQGGEVRTSHDFTERLFIYDRSVAFVPKVRERQAAPGAAMVTDPTVVGYLCRIFDTVWQSAQPFDGSDATEDPNMTSSVQMIILRLMASGLKDEVIARRLGMSTRTCRRHISMAMEELGATSRFQAGLVAGMRNLIPRYCEEAGSEEEPDAGECGG